MQKRLPKGVYIKDIWDKLRNSRQPYFNDDDAVIPTSEHYYWWITCFINQGPRTFVLSYRQPMLWKADSVPEEDVANPLYMEVRREVFWNRCKNGRLTYVQTENWNTGKICVVEYTEQREMVFFFLRRKNILEIRSLLQWSI